MKWTTILWDNDGVLVDTERHFFNASRQILIQEGITLSEEEFTDISLKQGQSVLRLLKQKGFTPEQIEKRRVARNKLYDEYLTTADLPVPGAEEVLIALKKQYRMFIVTGSCGEHFDTIHKQTGFLKYFEDSITCDEFSHNKPSPEPYLRGINKFNVDPDECVAIEDSPRGVESAKGAGLYCIAIPNPFSRDFDFSKADVVLNSIGEVPSYLEYKFT